MSKKPYSRTNIWGDIEHFDANGKKIGESRKGLFDGEYVNYDAKGHKTGTSREQLFGVGYNHYDKNGRKIGSSDENLWGGGYTNRDANGRITGTSDRSMLDLRSSGINEKNGSRYVGNHSEDVGEGCYIATAIYGSYDCPEVWALRKFRDNTLKKSWYGRAFIRTYYAISPKLVRWFGRTTWFRNLWKPFLDRMVQKLNEQD